MSSFCGIHATLKVVNNKLAKIIHTKDNLKHTKTSHSSLPEQKGGCELNDEARRDFQGRAFQRQEATTD